MNLTEGNAANKKLENNYWDQGKSVSWVTSCNAGVSEKNGERNSSKIVSGRLEAEERWNCLKSKVLLRISMIM